MWLFRGAQSAVFYYVSCAPCDEYSQRRKRKRDAALAKSLRDRPIKDAIVTDQPRPVYCQAGPYEANPYWREEIELGPGPPLRRANRSGGGSCHGSQRQLLLPPISPSSTKTSTNAGCVSRRNRSKSPLGDRWNRARYQREDEKLWGVAQVKGSSGGYLGRGRADTASSSTSYYSMGRAPEVNDLHPPIACGPRSREETRWMLQPPPSAKVMEGKANADGCIEQSRSGSISHAKELTRPLPESKTDSLQESNKPLLSCHPSPGLSLTATKPSNPSRPPPLLIAGEQLTAISESPDVKRPPLLMIASKQDLPQHIEVLKPSPKLHPRSNSPAPLSEKECAQVDLFAHRHTLQPDSLSSTSKTLAVASVGTRIFDANTRSVSQGQELSERNAMVNAGGGRLQVPQHSRPFRWSLDI